MKKLPNGYIAMYDISASGGYTSNGIYFDTGIVPTNTMSITALFQSYSNAYEWIFGARNSNSNTSAGQLNLLSGGGDSGTGVSYIGYYNTRINIGYGYTGDVLFYNKSNEFVVNDHGYLVNEYTGATNSFTGTKNIYILALNNGGTATYGTYLYCKLYGFKIEDGGVVLRDYAPAYKSSTQEYGLYDYANSNFITYQGSGSMGTYYLLTVSHSDGGMGYVETKNAGNVDKVYIRGVTKPVIKAQADKGYVFKHWESNGTVLSTEEEYNLPNVSADTEIKAVFAKEVDIEENTGYKLLGLQYGISDMLIDYNTNSVTDTTTPFARFNHFANILNASVVVDATSSATTIIECDDVPSTFVNNMPVFILNPKGKVVYCGVIKAIEDKKITCREPISIFDFDFVLYSKTYKSALMYFLYMLTRYARLGEATSKDIESSTATITKNDVPMRRMLAPFISTYDGYLSFDVSKAFNINAPVIADTSTVNLKDYLFEMFDSFGVYVKPSLTWHYYAGYSTDNGQGKKYLMKLEVFNPRQYDTMELSNNLECLSKVTVDVNEQETTTLDVFNSTGATFRGIYTVTNDGTIIEQLGTIDHTIPYENMLSFNSCKPKVILSDEKINVLVEQYLSNAQYNHKIEFDIDLKNSLLSLDAFQMGRRVDFYYGNKVYNSIVTGIKFNIEDNDIRSATVTLGKVRNKLTVKLNLGKNKK